MGQGNKNLKRNLGRNQKTKQERIEAEIARIQAGGRTPFSTDAAALANLNEKLKKVKGTTKKSNLKIKPAHENRGAAAAQEMARKRIAEGRNTVTGELKKPKKSNGSSTTKRGTGQGNRSLNRNATTTTPKKRKRIKSELWD